MSQRELQRIRAIGRAFPEGMPEIPPARDGEPFTRLPDNVRRGLRQLPRALALWAEIESWVGKYGGSADVAQWKIIDDLGWAPSTYWNARRQLIAMGMLVVEMPQRGSWFGPRARRRMTLVHYLPRAAREVVAKAAGHMMQAARKAAGLHPSAEGALARELAKAGAPVPNAHPPPG
jgi:hypothetical protein